MKKEAVARLIDGTHQGAKRESPHTMWHMLGSTLSQALAETIHNDNLLKATYCPIRNRDFEEILIAEIVSGIPYAFFCSKNNKGEDYDLSELINQFDTPNQFIVVAGDVGTGKTTFLHYNFRVRNVQYKIDHKVDGVLINLLEFGKGQNIPYEKGEDFIHGRIDSFLKAKYPDLVPSLSNANELFSEELFNFQGILADQKSIGDQNYKSQLLEYINIFASDLKILNKARLRYLHNILNKRVYIVIDNIDHFGQVTQEKIIGMAANIFSDYYCGLIVSIRQYSLPSTSKYEPLSAFQIRFLNLSLPDPKHVIQKRIEYVIQNNLIENIFRVHGGNTITIELPSGIKIIVNKDSLLTDLQNIANDILSDPDIMKMLQGVSDYDIRVILKLTRVALSSGYLHPRERDQGASVTPGDFLRAIILGNNSQYFPNQSAVINILDNDDPSDEYNSLIRLHLLRLIKNSNGVCVLLKSVVNEMVSVGYNKEKVLSLIGEFAKKDLIEFPYSDPVTWKNNDADISMKVTFCGHYYSDSLVHDIVYLQEMKNATYVTKTYSDSIKALIEKGRRATTKKERIIARLDATEVFIKYIEEVENKKWSAIHHSGDPSANLTLGKIGTFGDGIMETFKTSKNRIISSL